MALVKIDKALELFIDLTGDELKAVKDKAADNAAKRGDLTTLPEDFTAEERSSVVAALTKVYNATPSGSEIRTAANDAIAAWVDTAPEALNTVIELATAITENDDDLAAIMTALGNRVRVDEYQNFTDEQKAMGRSNIDSPSNAELKAATEVEEDAFVNRFNARLNA